MIQLKRKIPETTQANYAKLVCTRVEVGAMQNPTARGIRLVDYKATILSASQVSKPAIMCSDAVRHGKEYSRRAIGLVVYMAVASRHLSLAYITSGYHQERQG